MHIKKIDGKWKVQIQVNNIRKTKRFESKKSASRWAEETKIKILQNQNLEKINITLREVIKDYIEQFTAHKKTAEKETKMWIRFVRDNPELVNMKISQIKPQHILFFKKKKGNDGKRITNYYLCLLNNLFRKCLNVWLYPLPLNPVANIEHFKIPKGRYRPIERKEYKKLLTSSDKYFRLGIILLKNTGMRHSELHKLTHNDIDPIRKKLIVRLPKNNKLRSVPVSDWVISEINKTKQLGSHHVIPFSQNAFALRFKRVLKRFDNPTLQIHDFRRHYTAKLVDSRMNLFDIARRTGHQSISMIQHYYGFNLR